ncbi:MAG: hypothetical protein ACOYLK_14700 [Sphingomonas sp.]
MADVDPMPERSPLVDPRTGMMHPDWVRWLTKLVTTIRGLS